jgi:hypothetical protein
MTVLLVRGWCSPAASLIAFNSILAKPPLLGRLLGDFVGLIDDNKILKESGNESAT